MKEANVIETMPTYLGEQLYPNGVPVAAVNISVNGKSVQEIYFDVRRSEYEVNVLEDYIRYYIAAPCFIVADDDLAESKTMSYSDLFDLCLDYGIDPL